MSDVKLLHIYYKTIMCHLQQNLLTENTSVWGGKERGECHLSAEVLRVVVT